MRAYLFGLLLFPLAGLGGAPTLPSFEQKLPEPSLSMSEAARRGESLRQVAPPLSEQFARGAIRRSDALRHKPADGMPVLKPRDDVDYKLRVQTPDDDVDYKLRVVPGDRVAR